MQDFRRLSVWAKAHELTLAIYRSSSGFPREENYGLTSQMRRAAASIPANIAEGCGRSGNPELLYFLNVSLGSASELQYHLLLAKDLGFWSDGEYARLDTMLREVKQMLTSLAKRIRAA